MQLIYSLIILFFLGSINAFCEDSDKGEGKTEEAVLTPEELEVLLDKHIPLPEESEVNQGSQFDLLLKSPDYLVLSKLMKKKIQPLNTDESLKAGEWPETEVEAINDVFQFDINNFFTVRRPYFLYDPYEFLTTVEKQEIEGLLASHAGTSETNVYTLILSPDDYNQLKLLRETASRYFSDYEQAVLLIYFYENPVVTEVVFSSSLSKLIGKEGQETLNQFSSTSENLSGLNPYNTLTAFLSGFSLRIGEVLPKRSVLPVSRKISPTQSSPATGDSIESKGVNWMKFIIPIIALLGIGAGVFFALKKKKPKSTPLVLKETTLPLGFPRASYCSGMMSFEEKSASPEEQFDKLYKKP